MRLVNIGESLKILTYDHGSMTFINKFKVLIFLMISPFALHKYKAGLMHLNYNI